MSGRAMQADESHISKNILGIEFTVSAFGHLIE